MKVQDTHTNGTSCCKEPIDQNPPTGCCSSQETATYACCCSGEKTMNEPCCCGRQEAEAQEGCCSHQETAYQAGCCKATDNLDDDHNQVSHPDMDSLGELQMLLMEANNKYMRLYAEFDNFKKRHAKERMALVDKANEQTLKELLPIVDDFDRCILSLQGAEGGLQHIEGIKLIYDKLGGLLKKYGVQEIEIEQGSPFNPDLHEAIMQQPVDDPEIKGKIVSVVEKGYLINAYVLRFAKVIIGV